MKYIAVLFSLYLVMLALMPCGDGADVSSAAQTTVELKKGPGGIENCSQEGCAPFCSCNCCSIGKNFPLQQTTTMVQPVMQLSYAVYAISAIKKQPVDVWQPPKLS